MKARTVNTDYESMPGKFIVSKALKLPRFKFDTLYKNSSRNNILSWTAFIELDKDTKKTNLYESDLKGIKSYYWTESVENGENGGTVKKSQPTFITEGKNIGKSNQTNVFTQALSECYSIYMDKIKKGYGTSKTIKQNNIRKPPMLLYNYEKYKNKVVFPAYVQAKRDGILYSMAVNPDTNKLEIYSRNRLVFSNTKRQEKELKPIFDKYPGLELYGEAYQHDMSLQEISGIVRNENLENKLEIFIFDCVPPSSHESSDSDSSDSTDKSEKDMSKTPYSERLKFVKRIFKEFPDMKYIKYVKTYEVANEKELMEHYKKFMKDGYEGAIYRNPKGIYKYSTTTSRSWEVLKIKPRKSSEFKVSGFKDGNGKNAGLVTFIMETEDGKKFNADPNMPEDMRRKLFIEFQKKFHYKNKMATIEYSELSDLGVPMQPKFITIRDYE